MENEKKPLGVLFNEIFYYSQENLDSIVNDMTYQQAIFFIIKALEYSHISGIYSLNESEIVSKSIRILRKKGSDSDE